MSTSRSLGLLASLVSAALVPSLIVGCGSDPVVDETEPWTSYTTSTTTTTTTTTSTQTCPTGQTLCNSECTVVEFDPDNCGSCNNACGADQVCVNSTCGSDCTGGTTRCGNVCVNTDTDQQNCGACDNPCPAGEVCDGYGRCLLQCPEGLTACGETCVNTNSDQQNCGECDIPCTGGQVCDGAGNCDMSCAATLVLCDGICVNPLTDEDYCGASGDCADPNGGTQCSSAEICQNGSCNAVTCNDGQEATPNANDTEATAAILNPDPVGDCDDPAQLLGVVDGSNADVDWYYYQGNDGWCSVNPRVALTQADDPVRVCMFLECVNVDATLEFSCPAGTTAATSEGGRFGCCETGTAVDFEIGNVNCTGTTSEDLHVYMRVDDPTLSVGTCATYVMDYNF